MIARRNEICREYALGVDHKHCVGCMLVLKYMEDNHPGTEYGTQDQWLQETAYCQLHEREIFKQFLIEQGINLG